MGSMDPKGDRKRRAERKADKKKGDEPTETFYEASNRLRRDLEKSGRRDLSGPTKRAREALEKRGRGVKPVSAAKVDTKPAAKANGKAKDTFKQAFAAARKEQGAGGKFTWNGKKYTTDRADDKPKEIKGNGIVSKITEALTPKKTPEAVKKTSRKYKSSAPDTGINRKRGARQKSRMRKELRANTKSEEEAKAKKATPAATPAPEPAVKKRTGQQGKQLRGMQMAERARNSKEDKDEKVLLSGAKGKQARGQRKSKGGSVKKSGYASGGKVRGVGAAKRGFGRGRIV